MAKNRDDRRPFDLVIEWGSATLRNSQCMYWGKKGRRLEGDEKQEEDRVEANSG